MLSHGSCSASAAVGRCSGARSNSCEMNWGAAGAKLRQHAAANEGVSVHASAAEPYGKLAEASTYAVIPAAHKSAAHDELSSGAA